MATVPQKTLNWLWDVLRREYRDPSRAYSDVAQTLALYPAFAPRTDVYTSENGASALLLHLNGTLPVNFRGNQYRFPIAIWIPHGYPLESPIVYVTATDDMVIRPGQHVSASDGKVYHPYLARWREALDRSTISDFLKQLADVFAREPPVMSRQQMPPRPQSTASGQQQPPPRPPLPNEQWPSSTRPHSVAGAPPPPPPKQSDQLNGALPSSSAPPESPRPGRYDAPPPLPGQASPPRARSVVSSLQGYQSQPYPLPQRQTSLRQAFSPQQQSPPPQQYQQQRQPMTDPSLNMRAQQQQAMPQASPQHISYQHHQPQRGPPLSQLQYQPQQPQAYAPSQPQSQPQYRPQHQQQQAPQPKPQQPNIMDDSPFDISLPSSTTTNLPTPAIPPNPEKQHILSTLQSTLLTTLQNQITQNTSALQPLQSQHTALQQAQQTLQSELNQLQSLQSQLQQNISSLTTTISTADRTITNAQSSSSPDKIPAIDDLIIPPTIVARQLYDSVAEQRGYEAAIYALTEGFVRGRIAGEMWARKTRECAREEFRRKWLVRRVGRGMGLDANAP